MSLKSMLIMLTGLVILAILSLFCINHHSPLIETDLQRRTMASLEFEGMSWSRASTDGQIITLSGFAPNQALRQKAGEVALAVWGVDAVINHLVVTQQPETESAQAVPQNRFDKPSDPILSPYEFKLAYDGKTAILSGYIPDDKTRSDFREATRQHLGKGSVITRLKIARGAPKGFVETITQGLIPYLKDFTQVTALLKGSDLNITGAMSSGKMRETLQQSIRNTIPGHITTTFNIEVPEEKPLAELPAEQEIITAGLCQKQINDLLADQQVSFSTQAIIDQSSYILLDSIISTTQKCPETKIEIAGYTDTRGGNNQNKTLGQRRADAVMSYFISKGIDTERLTSKGYEEIRPLTSNTAQEDQTANRSIEFKILEQ